MSNDEPYNGPERRAALQLSEEQLNDIAERAYKRATEHIYLEVGKATFRAGLLVIGAGLLAFATWLGFDASKFSGR